MGGLVKGLFGGGRDRAAEAKQEAIAEVQRRQMAEQDTQRAELEQSGAALQTRLGQNRRRGILSFMETGDSGLKTVLGG